MSDSADPNAALIQLATQLSQQRAAFDDAFALPVAERGEALANLIILRVGEDEFALRLEELTGLQRCGAIVPIWGARPEMIGIAGIGGRVVPVFSLAHMLGYRGTENAWRWQVLCGTDDAVAFAFGGFAGLRQLERKDIHKASSTDDIHTYPHIGELARCADQVYPVINLSSIVAVIRQQIERDDVDAPSTLS